MAISHLVLKEDLLDEYLSDEIDSVHTPVLPPYLEKIVQSNPPVDPPPLNDEDY